MIPIIDLPAPARLAISPMFNLLLIAWSAARDDNESIRISIGPRRGQRERGWSYEAGGRHLACGSSLSGPASGNLPSGALT